MRRKCGEFMNCNFACIHKTEKCCIRGTLCYQELCVFWKNCKLCNSLHCKPQEEPEFSKKEFSVTKNPLPNNAQDICVFIEGYATPTNYSYGCLFLSNGKELKRLSGIGNDCELLKMKKNAGKIMGSIAAIEYANEQKFNSLTIFYNYLGIQGWGTGKWKAGLSHTQYYATTCKQSKTPLQFKHLENAGEFFECRIALELAIKATKGELLI